MTNGRLELLSILVSSITWLENNVFLIVHTPSTLDSESAPASIFHVVTRLASFEYVFQKIGDPATPFGLNRSPPHHFLIRLRDFPPNLQDLLIVASSASTDIGLFTRSKAPLTSGKAADKITGVFTMTEMSDDSRRAQLPMTEDMTDTSPIGVGLDLSSRDKVIKPIAGDEIEESLTPVPAFMVLNNEGILASWWVIYTESIRQGTAYPGLTGVSGVQQSTQAVSTQQTQLCSGVIAKSGFEKPSFGTPSGPGITAMTTFGAVSGLQKAPSPWATPAASNTTSSGNALGTSNIDPMAPSAAQGISFGSSALLGSRSSPWATGSTKVPGMAFGQPGGLVMGASPLGMALRRSVNNTVAPSSGGFASFANQGGFPTMTAPQANTGSIFGSERQASGSTAPSTGATTSQADSGGVFELKPQVGGSTALGTFASAENRFSFGGTSPKNTEKPMSLLGSAGFTLGSTFKPDASTKDNNLKPPNGGGISFSSNFGAALGDAQKAIVASTLELTGADMDEDEPNEFLQSVGEEPGSPKKQMDSSSRQVPASTTPMSTPTTLKFQFPNPVPPVKGKLFGEPEENSSTDIYTEKPIGLSSGTSSTISGSNLRLFSATKSPPSLHPSTPENAQIKQVPQSNEKPENALTGIPEPPLPPDPTSKTSYTVGESSVSSTEPDAPFPPDFLPEGPLGKTETLKWPSADIVNKDSITTDSSFQNDTPGGPEEREYSDFESEEDQSDNQSEEGSGEDIAKDVSPVSDSQQTPGITPQSSFGGTHRAGDNSSLFTKIPQPSQDQKPHSLFGEIDTRADIKLPPPPKQLSPRSPSPVRTSIPSKVRPEASRSISAPGIASQLLSSRRPAVNRLPRTSSGSFTNLLEQKRAETRRQEEIKARKEAEESQALIDEEDDTIQRFLRQDIVGSKNLDDFIAHQDYVGNADKDSIPAQVEAVYRDINSMIDTLGINSCALKSFIKGHTEQYKQPRRTTEDLEGDDEWCLVEIEGLSNVVERDLQEELDQGQIKDVIDKLHACTDLERDLVRLRAKHDDIKALLTSRSDPDRLIIVRSLPLTAEQAAQQHDLRRDFANFQKLLSEAEEGLVLVRAKLASRTSGGCKVAAGPTVEAVVRTITKMTAMIEKRSGDIDVLENQMRKIRFGSAISNNSREGSPFTTPVKSPIRNQGTSSAYGLFCTPDSVKGISRTSLISSTHSYGHGTPRKKMSSFTDEKKQLLKAYTIRRKEVTDKLNASLQKSGARILLMDDP
jgi:nucleoporin NUP159